MERGCPRESLATSDSRVSSPKAAKTRAGAFRLTAMALGRLRDMALNILHLLRPAAVISPERFQAPMSGELVEAGLGEHQQSSLRGFLQPEFDEGGRLLRVIEVRFD